MGVHSSSMSKSDAWTFFFLLYSNTKTRWQNLGEEKERRIFQIKEKHWDKTHTHSKSGVQKRKLLSLSFENLYLIGQKEKDLGKWTLFFELERQRADFWTKLILVSSSTVHNSRTDCQYLITNICLLLLPLPRSLCTNPKV